MFDTKTRLLLFCLPKRCSWSRLKKCSSGSRLQPAKKLAPAAPALQHCIWLWSKTCHAVRVKEWIEWCAPIALFKRVTVCKWFTQVTRNKRATVSDSLKSLVTREWQERFALFHEQITLSLFRSQQTSKSLEKPMREFPTLEGGAHMGFITLLKQ